MCENKKKIYNDRACVKKKTLIDKVCKFLKLHGKIHRKILMPKF